MAVFNMGVEDVLASRVEPESRNCGWVFAIFCVSRSIRWNFSAIENVGNPRIAGRGAEREPLGSLHKETIFTLVKAAQFHYDDGGVQ